jgi:hypothetical protein
LILAHLPLPLFFVLSHDGVYTELGYIRFGLFHFLVVFGIVFAFFIPVSALIADRMVENAYLCHNGHRFFFF